MKYKQKQIRLGELLYRLSKKVKQVSERITPNLTHVVVTRKEPDLDFHGCSVELLPLRNNFELREEEYKVCDDGYHLSPIDKRLIRDILWVFYNRSLIRSGIGEQAKFNRQLPDGRETERAVPLFKRPYQDTVIVSAIYSGGPAKSDWVESYIVSSSKDDLLEAYTSKL